MFIDKYYPHEYIEDVYSIDYDALLRQGIRGLIFDIDNTLVPHGADSTPAVDAFFSTLHNKGFKTLLLSNNSESRIQRFNAHIGTLYIYDAGKPHPAAYEAAVQSMGLNKEEVVMIGDQVFTDICGANRSGIPGILVKYIGYYKKEKKGIRRRIEKVILYCYRHSNKTHRLGNITLKTQNPNK